MMLLVLLMIMVVVGTVMVRDLTSSNKQHEAIGTAFAVLSDGDKRAHYDRYGDDDGPQVIRSWSVNVFSLWSDCFD